MVPPFWPRFPAGLGNASLPGAPGGAGGKLADCSNPGLVAPGSRQRWVRGRCGEAIRSHAPAGASSTSVMALQLWTTQWAAPLSEGAIQACLHVETR